jgi:hypothetical protein
MRAAHREVGGHGVHLRVRAALHADATGSTGSMQGDPPHPPWVGQCFEPGLVSALGY